MTGDKRALIKAAKKAGLRRGPNGTARAFTLFDRQGNEVFFGSVENTASLQDAKRRLRRLGFDVR